MIMYEKPSSDGTLSLNSLVSICTPGRREAMELSVLPKNTTQSVLGQDSNPDRTIRRRGP